MDTFVSFADVGDEAEVELAAGQVVGYGVLGILDIGYPVVGVDVVDAKQVEGVYSHPDVFEKS